MEDVARLQLSRTGNARWLGLGSFLADNLLPALLFSWAALLRGTGFLTALGRGVPEAGLDGWLDHGFGLAHQALSCAFFGLIAGLFLLRRSRRGARARPLAMVVALGGTLIMNAALIQPVTLDDWRLLMVADLLMAAGLGFSIYAAASLQRCFGMAPEARGLVTGGAYRLVRHPLYLGEFVAFLGALLPVLSPFTLLIYLTFCGLQARRVALEERVLAETFPEYGEYRRRTPALVPWPRPS